MVLFNQTHKSYDVHVNNNYHGTHHNTFYVLIWMRTEGPNCGADIIGHQSGNSINCNVRMITVATTTTYKLRDSLVHSYLDSRSRNQSNNMSSNGIMMTTLVIHDSLFSLRIELWDEIMIWQLNVIIFILFSPMLMCRRYSGICYPNYWKNSFLKKGNAGQISFLKVLQGV